MPVTPPPRDNSSRPPRPHRIGTTWFAPALLLAGFLLVFGAVLLLTHQIKFQARQDELTADAESLGEILRLRLKGNSDYLNLLAQQRSSGTLNQSKFQELGSQYVHQHPELINITWVDADHIIQTVAPLAANKQIIGLHLDLPEPKRASLLAQRLRQPQYTRPFEAIQGKISFEVWVPVFSGERFVGLFAGVYSCDRVLNELISADRRKEYHITLISTAGAVLAENPQHLPINHKLVHDVLVTSPGSGVVLRVKGYEDDRLGWRLLLLEFCCLALVMAMSYALWSLKRENTNRKEIEEALRTSQALLQETMQQAKMAYWEYDLATRQVVFSTELLSMLGAAEAINEERMPVDAFISRFILPDDAQPVADAIMQVDTSTDPTFSCQLEVREVRQDGSIINAIIRLTTVRDKQGRLVRCIGSNQDISDRKQAEMALARQQMLLNNIIEGSNDAIFAKDTTGRYLVVNQEVARIFGKPASAIIGRDDSEFFPANEAAALMKDDAEIMQSGKVRTKEEWLTTIDGQRIYVATKGPIHDETGNIIGLFGISRDVTEHRRLEEQLRQSLKMESIGRLAGGVAHDFNNKLTVILGYAEMTKIGVPEESVLWHNLDQISKAAGHSRDITGKLLAFSRQQLISPKAMSLNLALADIQRTLPRMIGEDIVLSFSLAPDLWLVKMDPTQFDQIVMNLAVNARDAMPTGGKLVVSTSNAVIDTRLYHKNLDAKPGQYVCLSVGDTGQGISPENLKHVFEPFFTTKEIGKGTGLGLATIYGIVTQNGGFVDVYSEVGYGTVFKIYLPRLLGGEPDESSVPPSEVAGSGSILLVEDDDTVRAMTVEMLRQMGYTVESVARPQEAVRLCREGLPVDLVLTDVIMPNMNGREMMEAILALRPDVRVLFMSGYSYEVISEKGVIDTSTHFIQKPFDMQSLHRKIQDALSS